MSAHDHIHPDEIRTHFAHAMSDMFRAEVRSHGNSTVSLDTYNKLHDAHRLIADVVSFKGPHVNHLTPRVLDIDAAQTPAGIAAGERHRLPATVEALVEQGFLRFDPIVTEDFLPVSAAGIFQSNPGTDEQRNYGEQSNRAAFEQGLGAKVHDELGLYARAERASLAQSLIRLGSPHIAFKASA